MDCTMELFVSWINPMNTLLDTFREVLIQAYSLYDFLTLKLNKLLLLLFSLKVSQSIFIDFSNSQRFNFKRRIKRACLLLSASHIFEDDIGCVVGKLMHNIQKSYSKTFNTLSCVLLWFKLLFCFVQTFKTLPITHKSAHSFSSLSGLCIQGKH